TTNPHKQDTHSAAYTPTCPHIPQTRRISTLPTRSNYPTKSRTPPSSPTPGKNTSPRSPPTSATICYTPTIPGLPATTLPSAKRRPRHGASGRAGPAACTPTRRSSHATQTTSSPSRLPGSSATISSTAPSSTTTDNCSPTSNVSGTSPP